MGMSGEGRIPGSAIRAFAQDYGYRGETAQWFRNVIREMDAEYLGIRTVDAGSGLMNETPMNDHKGIRAMLRRHAKPARAPIDPIE